MQLQSTSASQNNSTEHKSSHDSQLTMGEHQQSSLLTSDSWSLGNIWSTITFGWFGSTQQNPEENSCERLNEGSVVSTSVASGVEETTESHVINESDRKRLEFVQEMSDYYQRHSDERVSCLPTVGLSAKGPSRVTFGAKLTSRFTRLKSRVLSHVMEASKLEVEGQEDAPSESDCCGSKIADLACLEMESHDHTCVNEADKVGNWFEYKISEFEQNLYSFSSDQSELSYHFYPMIGLQDHNKVANAIDRLVSLVQGSPLATILETIESLTHTYDHILGTDYHLDRTLAAYSRSLKTQWNQILSGVVSEIANELQELKETISLSNSSQSHDANSSTNLKDSTLKRDKESTVSEGTCTPTENLVSERTSTMSNDHRRVHKQAKHSENILDISRTSGLEINSFHHFDDVHLPGDEVNGPPVSGELGQELLSMLRMVRLKVRQERQLRPVNADGANVSRDGEAAMTTQSEGTRGEEASSSAQIQSGMDCISYTM